MVPEGIDGQKLRADMEKTDAVIVMGGQDQLKGKIIRIGHMGAISDQDMLLALDSLAQSLNRSKPGLIAADRLAVAKETATTLLRQAPAVVLKTSNEG